MEGRTTRLEPAALLAHAGWLRALAASLLADPGAVDDVVQETWLAALRRPPSGDRPLEPWLARVARNFALRRRRGETRRAAHELSAEPPAAAPNAAQTVERIELQRVVVEAVLAIDEPFRTAIVQRYFEGRSGAEIARLLGVPAGTVRWRLKRGLGELRERLDARFGSRSDWCAWLAPLAGRAGGSISGAAAATGTHGVLEGVLAMSAMNAAAVVVGTLVLFGAVWWRTVAEARQDAPDAMTSTATQAEPLALAAAEAPDGSGLRAASAQDARAAVVDLGAPPAATVESSMETSTARAAAVDVRFVDTAGAPWSGVRFELPSTSLPHDQRPQPTYSAPDGRARLELVFPERRRRGELLDELSLDFLASRAGCTTVGRSALVRVGSTAHLGDVVLGPGVRLSGSVVDDRGRGIAGATIGLTSAELPSDDDGHLRRVGAESFARVPGATSAEDGSFVLDGIGAGTWRLWGHAAGTRYGWSEAIAVSAARDLSGLALVLPTLLATDRIEGRIVGPEGEPVRAGLMCFVHDTRHGGRSEGTRVDERGRFAIVIEDDGEVWDLTALDPTSSLAATSVEGVLPGTLDLVIRMHAARSLELVVRDPDQRDVEGVAVELGMNRAGSKAQLEEIAPGRYRMQLPDAPFSLEVSAPGFHTFTTERRALLDPATLSSPLEIVLHRAPIVRGRVVAAGRAVAGAHVELRRDMPEALETVNGFRCVMNSMADARGSTVADGAFELTCDLDGAVWVRASAPGLAPGELGPLDVAQLGADLVLELNEGGAIEGRVLLPEGRDGEGTIVAVNHGDGAPRTQRAGPDGSFRFEHLCVGRWQVLANAAEVDPTRRAYTSLPEAEPIEWNCEVSAGRSTRCDLDLRPK